LDALAGFLHRSVRQTDDDHRWQARAGVDFNLDHDAI
jgi:hypothetical protein